jgi:hypothetical protein
MKLLGTIESFLQSNRTLDAQKNFNQCKECFLRIFMLDKSLAVRSEYYLKYLRCLKITMKVTHASSISFRCWFLDFQPFLCFPFHFWSICFQVIAVVVRNRASIYGTFNFINIAICFVTTIQSCNDTSLSPEVGYFWKLSTLSDVFRFYSLFGNVMNSQHAGFVVEKIDLQHVIENFRRRIEIVQKYSLCECPCVWFTN